MEVCRAIHCVSPLRRHYSDTVEMGFDRGGIGRGGEESGVVDEQRLLLDGCIGYQIESGDLVRGDAEIFQWG